MREDFKGINENTPDLPHLLGSTIYRLHLSINPHLCKKQPAGQAVDISISESVEALEAQAGGDHKDAAEDIARR